MRLGEFVHKLSKEEALPQLMWFLINGISALVQLLERLNRYNDDYVKIGVLGLRSKEGAAILQDDI